MPDYPVMFMVRDAVSGNGFLAGVTLSGRAVMCKEDDNTWWIYGVRPGAIAESGQTPQEAFARFRNAYKNFLFDVAEEAGTYDEFRERVEAFYYQPDLEEEARWEAAFRAIRSGETKPEDGFFSNLPKQAPETRPTQLTVERLDKENARYQPTDNVPDYFALPNAAQGMSAEQSFADVERMLEHCAPGATIRRTNHFRQVTFGKIVFPTLPKHDMIEVGHIRKMARTLGILECAKKFLRL